HVVSPLTHLPEFVAHEEQLFTGLGKHISVKQTKVGEPLPLISRHFADDRTLPVHDLIVRKRQHEIFAESINHPEGEHTLMKSAMNWVVLKIFQGVVHPAHVPLHAEAEAAQINRLR